LKNYWEKENNAALTSCLHERKKLSSGNNFFKLRDLMEVLDVYVGYDNATKAITLDTSKGYTPE
jgi:hypothetical protein